MRDIRVKGVHEVKIVCPICLCGMGRAQTKYRLICGPCGISYDRMRRHDDTNVYRSLVWAADRARKFYRKAEHDRG